MKTFNAAIDHGDLGFHAIQAETILDALATAVEWAKLGEYGDEPCEVRVEVWDDEESVSTRVSVQP